MITLYEWTNRRYVVNRQKALNRAAGRQSINLASKSLREQYRRCRQRCLAIKARIQKATAARARMNARRSVK